MATMWPDLADAASSLGTLHEARFVILSETTLGFLASYNGPFDDLVGALATRLGAVLDVILESVVNPPPTPVEEHLDRFVQWVAEHDLPPLPASYSAYPDLSVGDIKNLAEQRP